MSFSFLTLHKNIGHCQTVYTCFIPSHRFVTQLLSDLVYFVTEHDTGREDVLNISVQNPNRDRQKLMREQYILKEVARYNLYLSQVWAKNKTLATIIKSLS